MASLDMNVRDNSIISREEGLMLQSDFLDAKFMNGSKKECIIEHFQGRENGWFILGEVAKKAKNILKSKENQIVFNNNNEVIMVKINDDELNRSTKLLDHLGLPMVVVSVEDLKEFEKKQAKEEKKNEKQLDESVEKKEEKKVKATKKKSSTTKKSSVKSKDKKEVKATATKKKKEADAKKVESKAKPKSTKEVVEPKPKEVEKQEIAPEDKVNKSVQLKTVNNEKISHAHIYEAKYAPNTYRFICRVNGIEQKSRLVDPQDALLWTKKEISARDMMNKYYPELMQPKLSEAAYASGVKLADGRIVEKLSPYTDKTPGSKYEGQKRFFACVFNPNAKEGEDLKKMMSIQASDWMNQVYNARIKTPAELVTEFFGERLQLKGAYDKYTLPPGVEFDQIGSRITKGEGENKGWYISAEIKNAQQGDLGEKKLLDMDRTALMYNKITSREQLVAKYFYNEICAYQSAIKVDINQKQEVEQSKGMKR